MTERQNNHYSVFLKNIMTTELSVIGIFAATYSEACQAAEVLKTVHQIVFDIRKD